MTGWPYRYHCREDSVKLIVALIAGLVAFDAAAAADTPSAGILYNQREDSSLSYTCTLQEGEDRLRCQFIQTAVRKKAKLTDIGKVLDDARRNYPGAVKDFSDPRQCRIVNAWFDMASGKVSVDAALAGNPEIASDAAKFKEGMDRLREDAQANPGLLDSFRALAGMCDDPSEENFLKIAKADHEKKVRTCSVSSNPFTQEFVWVSDFGTSGAWVVSSQPEGPCGIVQLSRFEQDRSEGSGLLWRYTARKAATNPSGTAMPGLSCSAVDQGEYVYDWKKSRSDYMQCEFVEFSPF